MVRAGNRAKTLVTSVKENGACDSPKRKDLRLDYSEKEMIIPNSISKSQTLINFFHTAQENSSTLPKTLHSNVSNNKVNNEAKPTTGVTPHRIELCSEGQSSSTSDLSQLHIASKKSTVPKAKRRLNTDSDNTLDKNNINSSNHTITEYFPVRRSVRKTKKTVLEEKQTKIEQCIRNEVDEGLAIHNFFGKGRGVVASQFFCKGDFVVEYKGELIDMTEAKYREEKYAEDQNTGCYMYYFKHKTVQYCVDATAETGYLGRLVNHSRNGNLVTKTVSVDGIPRLILIAKEDIRAGEEVTYDYGDRSKESLKYHPWLAT